MLYRRNLCNDNGNCKADHKDHRCVDFTVHPKPKKRENIHNNIKKKGIIDPPAPFVKGLDNLPTILGLFLLLVVQSGLHLSNLWMTRRKLFLTLLTSCL